MSKNNLYCYFCGSKEKAVDYLIEGDDAYICDLCLPQCAVVLHT